jgi:hypothetical protein
MFVKTLSGAYFPVASIEHLSEDANESGEKVETARFKDGKTEQLCAGEIERMMEASAHPFPAAPDTFVLQQVVDEDNRLSLERVPVLGWIVSPKRGVLPITIDGINHGSGGAVPVVMPTGEVVVAMECSYLNQECYFAEIRSAKVR